MSKGAKSLEWCTDYHCSGDCGLAGHGVQHKSAAKTTAERQRAFRADMKRQGLTEVRGIFAKPEQHQAIKEVAKQMLDTAHKPVV